MTAPLFSLALFLNLPLYHSLPSMIQNPTIQRAQVFSARGQDGELDSKLLLQKALLAGLEPLPDARDLSTYQASYIKKHKLAAPYKPRPTRIQLELGKKLYFEPRLSHSQLISCNSCHNLASGGTSLVPLARGEEWRGDPQHLNTPSIYNVIFHSAQFWEGRGQNLGQSIASHIAEQATMASREKEVLERIAGNADYIDEFKAAYGNHVKISFPLITDTIALFLTSLNTPNRLDDFLNENPKALSKKEQLGLEVFLDKGCAQCHTGVNLGGALERFPREKPYEFAKVGGFTGDGSRQIKVPTLRNILDTPPYFHNGAYSQILDAIKAMGYTQLGITISDEEAESIATFFQALSGKYPNLRYPILPSPKPRVSRDKEQKQEKSKNTKKG